MANAKPVLIVLEVEGPEERKLTRLINCVVLNLLSGEKRLERNDYWSYCDGLALACGRSTGVLQSLLLCQLSLQIVPTSLIPSRCLFAAEAQMNYSLKPLFRCGPDLQPMSTNLLCFGGSRANLIIAIAAHYRETCVWLGRKSDPDKTFLSRSVGFKLICEYFF